jgi:hypothetical protein
MAEIYDKYPAWMVFIVIIFTLLVYFSGAYIMFTLSWITGILYIIFLLVLEFHTYKEACTSCCYYGKCCAFGKGAIAPIFFKKGNPQKFCEKEIKTKDLVPQVLVVAVPFLIGIALLISRGFNLWILLAMLYPVASWFFLNPIIYGKIACVHCKQGTICCPALKFFSKQDKK